MLLMRDPQRSDKGGWLQQRAAQIETIRMRQKFSVEASPLISAMTAVINVQPEVEKGLKLPTIL